MRRNCCQVSYKWAILVPDSHIRGKVKLVLELTNYATKKN